MSRSGYWRDVASVAETTRTDCESFDPETGDAATCIETGIAPIVSLYVRVRQQGEELSPVERSLLEGALTDWLAAFAACHDTPFGGGFTVREVALAWTENGTLDATVRELIGVDGHAGDEGSGPQGRA
jgi:hypothetical protein